MNDHSRQSAMLAVFAMRGLATPEPDRTLRCDPEIDDQTHIDLTAVCSRCGRRLTMDDIGGGPMGGPRVPYPACKGSK